MPETITVRALPQVASTGLCIGCGFCTLSLEAGRDHPPVRIVYDPQRDSFTPQLETTDDDVLDREVLCPGADMDLAGLTRSKFGALATDVMTGHIVSVSACHAGDEKLRAASASGGAIPALLTQLFSDGAIDTAYVVNPGNHVYDAHGALITEATSLGQCHGSVYHPVDFGRHLRTLIDSTARFAFVGLPCEIAALEQLKLKRPDVAARHVASIGLFCGGINAYQGVAYYLRGFGIEWPNIRSVRYRVGPWPGRIEVTDDKGVSHRIPRIQGNSRWRILRYVVAFQGYWMLPRCRMCPDQIADLADVAVGDPHLPRFRKGESSGPSVLLVRTARGQRLVDDAAAHGRLARSPLTRDELVASQGYTLDNRRHVSAYLDVAAKLGLARPRLGIDPQTVSSVRMRHFVYAWVDMLKIRVVGVRGLRWMYLVLQAFEYLFITFTPMLVARRLINLLKNR